MKKQFTAFLAASMITICIGAGLFAVGAAAYFNKNGTAVQNSSVPVAADASVSQQTAEVAQLQALVEQYKQREQEYQSREQQYQQQLNSASQQLQQDQQLLAQVQMLLSQLQRQGIITVFADGRIVINR